MAKIVKMKEVADGKVKCLIELDKKELTYIQGNFKGIYVFSPENNTIETSIMETGIHKSTKYFCVPRQLVVHFRKRGKKKHYLRPLSIPVSCFRLDGKDKAFFVYIISQTYPDPQNLPLSWMNF